MMKNYDSIRLFKKNREVNDTVQEDSTKEETSNSEQPLSDLITPFEVKDNKIPLKTNSKQPLLPPSLSKILRKVLKKLISRG